MTSYADVAQSVISGDEDLVKEQVNSLLAAGESPLKIIDEGLIAGMNVVGVRFKAGDMYVPEVLMSARSMSTGVEIVKPLIAVADMKVKVKVVLGTVKGDLHDIGKNLVRIMMESSGLEVIDVGIDISPEKFMDAIREHNPDVLAMSALLTTTMANMKSTIDVLVEEGLRDKVKVIVGGAPVSQEFADTIGADGFAADAASASDLCKALVAK
ncbi:corrinoid protein [Desulfosporosinus nitroreducens]|uniref:Corrinoid protein n=1 Tax=Desulfosporosinus nitroreducens TaxID=2018668 RepID=A0ABT8QTL4_9FIRM|nr:corrinoid protein [Desulfosporosinus nitroreducens]MCO1602362.1 corrinoid protein [Desulfosporosinus nitroreducens]MDO0824691.1 corrinoid protein [Desulfosporosinus nitroreducens]